MSSIVETVRKTKYSPEKKREAVELYVATGSAREVSELTGVSYATVINWKQQDWWQDIVADIKATEKIKLDAKLKRIIAKSLDIVEDRLENGEVVLNNKTGEMVRKPVGIRDSTRAAGELLSKRILIERNQEELQIRRDSMNDTLKVLATEFAKWVNKPQKQDVLDVEFKEINNAVHEERETGLQEGSEGVYITPGGGEEES